MWARYLRIFTADDIADAMLVDHAVGERAIKALVWHGIVEGTGDFISGSSNGDGPKEVFEYVPLPPGPKEHPHETPEWLATPGVYSEAPPRGRSVPGSGMSDQDMRRLRSIAGRTKKRQGST
jgi:hypothetical protein